MHLMLAISCFGNLKEKTITNYKIDIPKLDKRLTKILSRRYS